MCCERAHRATGRFATEAAKTTSQLRAVIGEYVEAAESTRERDLKVDITNSVPPPGHPGRSAILTEMVRVDLKVRWEPRVCPGSFPGETMPDDGWLMTDVRKRGGKRRIRFSRSAISHRSSAIFSPVSFGTDSKTAEATAEARPVQDIRSERSDAEPEDRLVLTDRSSNHNNPGDAQPASRAEWGRGKAGYERAVAIRAKLVKEVPGQAQCRGRLGFSLRYSRGGRGANFQHTVLDDLHSGRVMPAPAGFNRRRGSRVPGGVKVRSGVLAGVWAGAKC